MNIVVKKSNRKTISLKITSKGDLQVNCPFYCSNKDIEKLIISKQNWIAKNKQKIEQKYILNQKYFEYKKILLWGNEYNVEMTNSVIKIGEYTIKRISNSNIQSQIKQWLQKIAKSFILNRLQEISNSINIKYTSAQITSARKKWGSCSNTKQIKLNFRLAMLPIQFVDYVCIHELCHIKQMNHSKKFWHLVESFCPNYKHIKKEISQYSYVLELL